MRKELFEKIKKKFGKFSSFAIWGKDISDLSVIEKSINALHGQVFFVGYNTNGSVKKLQNFHKPHRGGKDGLWAQSIGQDSLLRGSYMTDFFKGDLAARESGVKKDKTIRTKNRKILSQEITLLREFHPIIVAIGRNTEKELLEAGYSCFYIPNPAARITKKFFVSKIKDLVSSIKKQS